MSFVEEEEEEEKKTRLLPCKFAKVANRGDILMHRGSSTIYSTGQKHESMLKIVNYRLTNQAFLVEAVFTVRAEEHGYGPIDVKYGECTEEKYGFILMKRGAPLKTMLDAYNTEKEAARQIPLLCPYILNTLSKMHKDGIFHQDPLLENFISYGKLGFRIINYDIAIPCGQDLTGTVAAAYDIMEAVMQLLGIESTSGVEEDVSFKQMCQLSRLLDDYWDQDAFVFLRKTIFQFVRADGKTFSTTFKPEKLQPDTIIRLRSHSHKGVVSFARKLLEEIPALVSVNLKTRLIAILMCDETIESKEIGQDFPPFAIVGPDENGVFAYDTSGKHYRVFRKR